MTTYLTLGLVVAVLLVIVSGAILIRRKQQSRGSNRLQHLLDLADSLERDLKTCRTRLQQAHAVMSLNPDLPAASEHDARQAVSAGLQALLQQRLWIRDHSAHASQSELDEAARSMRSSRERLQPLLQALTQAQSDLNNAMREQIRRDGEP